MPRFNDSQFYDIGFGDGFAGTPVPPHTWLRDWMKEAGISLCRADECEEAYLAGVADGEKEKVVCTAMDADENCQN